MLKVLEFSSLQSFDMEGNVKSRRLFSSHTLEIDTELKTVSISALSKKEIWELKESVLRPDFSLDLICILNDEKIIINVDVHGNWKIVRYNESVKLFK